MNNSEVFAYHGDPGPAWLDKHSWYFPVQLPNDEAAKMPKITLQKVLLKCSMCRPGCRKCGEILIEELREIEGVLDVKIDYDISKVTVIGMPDPMRVLRRARKVDKSAQFWVDPPEPVKEAAKDEKPKDEAAKEESKVAEDKSGEGDKKDEKAEGDKKEGEAKEGDAKDDKGDKKGDSEKKAETTPSVASTQYLPYDPYGSGYRDYRPSQSYHPLYPDYYYQTGYNSHVPLYTNPNYLKHVKIAY